MPLYENIKGILASNVIWLIDKPFKNSSIYVAYIAKYDWIGFPNQQVVE